MSNNNRLDENDTNSISGHNRSIYQQQQQQPSNAQILSQQHTMQPTPIPFMSPYQPQTNPWDMYYWNMYYAQQAAAQAHAEMAYREEMARKSSQYYTNANNNTLNSTMIEQKHLPSMGMPSVLPPPTPYYNPYDPYMNYSSLYSMPPPQLMIPPQTPIPHSFTNNSMQQSQYTEQPQQAIKQEMNNVRNISVSSLKELEFDNKNQPTVNHNEDIIEPKRERLTPLFHQRPHVKAIFGLNTIIQIQANDPCEGQPALVEIHNLYDIVEDYLNEDVNYKILKEYPGPLKRVGTETTQLLKGTIIQYCQKKAKDYLNINNQQLLNDSQSYSLIWDYLSLLVRQNGEIDLKTDLSSLLLNDNETWSTSTTPIVSKDDDYRSNTPNSEINSLTDNLNNRLKLNDDEILTKLRQLLSIGQRLDAIEWSIKHNLWSHAFFIATTTQNLDVKLIDKIKLKFINSFLIQDPLKTCYQLYIGRSPTIPINLIEWNDWRRHLAIILSNKDSFNKDIVLKSIKSIADSLSTNNRVAASHFCYLLANVQFGEYKKKSSKIVLIGSSHNQEYSKFCTLLAIQATEIYEYATNSILDNFLQYKLIYASRLIEYGLLNEAYKYLEIISKTINLNPNLHSSKISITFHLADRLRMHDLDSAQMNNSFENNSENYNEPDWFIELKENYKYLYFNNGEKRLETPIAVAKNEVENDDFVFKEPISNNKRAYTSNRQHSTEQIHTNHQIQQHEFIDDTNVSVKRKESKENIQFYQPLDPYNQYNTSNQTDQQPIETNQYPEYNAYQQPQQYPEYNHNSYQQQQQPEPPVIPMYQPPTQQNQPQFLDPFSQQPAPVPFDERDGKNEINNEPPPSSNDIDYDIYNTKKKPTENLSNGQTNQEFDLNNVKKEPIEDKTKSILKPEESSQGGLFGKVKGFIGLGGNKGQNETKKPKKAVLPSDKKKTIVWDEEKKQFINLAEPAQEETKIKPPPTSMPNSSSMPIIQNQNVPITSQPPGPSQQQQPSNNIYSLKSKGKTNYYAKLDVMGNSSKKIENSDIKPLLSSVPPPAAIPSNLYIPQQMPSNNENQQQQQMQFFNPTSFNQQQQTNYNFNQQI